MPVSIAILSAVEQANPRVEYYCPACAKPIHNPLVCGDCAGVICRDCGTPLESADELGFG